MLDGTIGELTPFSTAGRHSISGLSSGAFMTVQLHIAHSADYVGAGVIAGGPYRSAETFRAASFTVPTSCILNSLYIAMTPLTEVTAPDVPRLVALTRATPDIDDPAHLKGQRLYIFTGTADRVVNQHAVRKTRDYYLELGVDPADLIFVDDVAAGHSIITMNPEDNDLGANQPPYINRGDFVQSHAILDHIYPEATLPGRQAPKPARGELRRFEQAAFLPPDLVHFASMAPFGYVYIPSAVREGAEAIGVHVAIHGCKQGYSYVNFVNGRADMLNQAPYGGRYVTSTGYMEWAEANNLIVLFPQVGGHDDNDNQNPDGCWDWWGYSSPDPDRPDYYSQNAPQIHAIQAMVRRLAGA